MKHGRLRIIGAGSAIRVLRPHHGALQEQLQRDGFKSNYKNAAGT